MSAILSLPNAQASEVPLPAKDGASAVLFRGHSDDIVSTLIRNHIHVKGLDLAEIQKKVPNINWVQLRPDENIPDFAGKRRSAFYRVDENTVTVETEASLFTPELLSLISLHEAISVLGKVDDKRYQVSIGLFLLSQRLRRDQRKYVKDHMIQLAMGGGISVGGGGDAVALLMKARMLGQLSETPFGKFPGQMELATDLAVEPDYDPADDYIHIKFDSETGRPVVEFPAAVYVTSIEGRPLIEEAVRKLAQVLILKDPTTKVLAKIVCPGASGPLYFRGYQFVPAVEDIVKKVFAGQNCKVDYFR